MASPHSFLLLLGVILISFHSINAFDCSNYVGNSASTAFCTDVACNSYCISHPLADYCMDTNYIQSGYCSQINGFPSDQCTSVITGIAEQHKIWCQTVACEFSQQQCPGCQGVTLQQKIVELFGSYCKAVGTPLPSSSTSTKSTSSSSSSSKPTSPVTEDGWFCPAGWTGSDPCKKCAAPDGDKCPAFQWTQCYTSMAECEKSSGGSGGSGGFCGKECPKNSISMKRPSFKGANCYNSEYGSQFGPNWAPSGKTHYEKYVKDASALHSLLQTFKQSEVPMLSKFWGASGCDASVAVHENIVCAIELIEARNLRFDAPKNGGVGYTIGDFLNTGDEQINLMELAAFIGHKFKETGRLTAWEETPNPGYADCTNPEWPCVGSHYYHGRGPVQISWNYNYGPFSQWFYGDKMVLLGDPDKVDPEGPMGFIAALWFWMTPRDFTKGSLRTRDAVVHWTDGKLNSVYNDGKDYDSLAGFGLTTNVINGGIECNFSLGSDGHLWRVSYFLTLAQRLGVNVPSDEVVNDWNRCKNDKLCFGLFAGCAGSDPKSTAGVTCNPIEAGCGKQWTSDADWVTNLCKFN